jgi:hypothetical protein
MNDRMNCKRGHGKESRKQVKNKKVKETRKEGSKKEINK